MSEARWASWAEDGAVEPELVCRARSGDGVAFEELVRPFRRELQTHCYRILGSAADAEDALQESLTAAWQGLVGFEGRASLRTWLYRIATSRCLNMRRAIRRSPTNIPPMDVEPPEPSRLGEVLWLEPYPDAPVAEVADPTPGPEARYEQRENISLAFITALQLLPPRQRAALVLTDVLDFSAREVADLLDSTEQAIYSAVKRARTTLARRLPQSEPPPLLNSPEEKRVLDRLVRAWEECDTNALVALMTDDVWLRMPPNPLEYQGKERAVRCLGTIVLREGRHFRLVPTRANGQPAFGVYLFSPLSRVAHAFGLIVVTLAGDRLSAITQFDSGLMPRFGLPRSVAED
ncbi:MAG TPA: RNA polymerase subunit sigma-70 [Candidatus Dormibacteraeota bacterium]|nr:RNA polymerase subunit sigma-70 [Candidatus Dormibacteraeota bacterium]